MNKSNNQFKTGHLWESHSTGFWDNLWSGWSV